jgi:hypothetical protein
MMDDHKMNQSGIRHHPNSAFRCILLPFSIFLIFIFIFGLILFNQGTSNILDLNLWVNISIILVSLFLFIPEIFLLVLIILLTIFTTKFTGILKSGLGKVQSFTNGVSNFLIRLSEYILLPFSVFNTMKISSKNRTSRNQEANHE